MSKRSSGDAGFSLANLAAQTKRSNAGASASSSRRQPTNSRSNPFLSRPADPTHALKTFLHTARNEARRNIPPGVKLPIRKPFCEIEARLGVIKAPFGARPMRVLSSGPKRVPGRDGKMVISKAFLCSSDGSSQGRPQCTFEGGVTKTNFTNWTSAGLSEVSPLSFAFASSSKEKLKADIVEKELVETVYGGYPNSNRVCFPGIHNHSTKPTASSKKGQMENKSKLATIDLAVPAATYDLRVNLSTERTIDEHVIEPPKGYTTKRLKRRRSYMRRDKTFLWQLDVTEVTTTSMNSGEQGASIEYEIEVELDAATTLQLINEEDAKIVNNMCHALADQLWRMVTQLNPLSDVLDVEELLEDHPDNKAVQLARAQCGALKRFMDSRKSGGQGNWVSAISSSANSEMPSASLGNIKFPGCMPVNFSRHCIEEVQQSDDSGGYYLSEKTDGVRHFIVFTGDTVVLIDRAMKGKRPIPRTKGEDPMKSIVDLIRPGTVLDGEVVMNRKLQRPIFIVFDVLVSATNPVLHYKFSQRLECLKMAHFRTKTAKVNMFVEDIQTLKNSSAALPLVRKNFVKRTQIYDSLLRCVIEEQGLRTYKNNNDLHNHLTDGIIFQPNRPYVCGTDIHLNKWKYLDTVTIDVQIMPVGYFGRGYNADNDDDSLVVAVTGEDGTMVDMTRFIPLPKSELRRLEADRAENGAKIAEVGLEPSTGEWYYLTMRPDKIAPNHISTVLGTLLELAESLGTEELRYRMSVPSGGRDTYRRDMRKMQNQLLDHQMRTNKELMERRRHT